MKSYLKYIKISEDVDLKDLGENMTTIIFEEFSLFFKNYNEMIKWLNEHAINKEVYFISENDKIIGNDKDPWTVRKYSQSHNVKNNKLVRVDLGPSGDAKGLIYVDYNPLEEITPPKIRWYNKGKLESYVFEAAINKEYTVMFRDILENHFYGDYDEMINWLNENAIEKEVYFIGGDGKIYKNHGSSWEIREYEHADYRNIVKVKVTMTTNEYGTAAGLKYLGYNMEEVFNTTKVKWYYKEKGE